LLARISILDLTPASFRPGILIVGMPTIEKVDILANSVGKMLVSKGDFHSRGDFQLRYMNNQAKLRELKLSNVIKEKARKERFNGLLREATALVLPFDYSHDFKNVHPKSNIISMIVSAQAHSSAGQERDFVNLCVFEYYSWPTIKVYTRPMPRG